MTSQLASLQTRLRSRKTPSLETPRSSHQLHFEEDDNRFNAYMSAYNHDVDDLDLLMDMKPIETESEHQARLSQMTRLAAWRQMKIKRNGIAAGA